MLFFPPQLFSHIFLLSQFGSSRLLNFACSSVLKLLHFPFSKKKDSCSSRSSNHFHAEYLKSYWIASSCSSSSGSCLLQTTDCTPAQTRSPSPLTWFPNPLTKRFNPRTFCLISTSKLLQSTYTLLKSAGMLRGAKAYLFRFWIRQSKAEQCKTRQGKARQSKAEQGVTCDTLVSSSGIQENPNWGRAGFIRIQSYECSHTNTVIRLQSYKLQSYQCSHTNAVIRMQSYKYGHTNAVIRTH